MAESYSELDAPTQPFVSDKSFNAAGTISKMWRII
jgi:hypothetical protein